MYQIQAHPYLTTLFDQPYLRFVLEAMQAGNSPALIWVDDPAAPRSAWAWDGTYCLYAGGAADNAAVSAWLRGTFLPLLEREHREGFKITLADSAWEEPIRAVFPTYNLIRAPRVFYQLNPARIPPAPELPAGWELRLIDRELLAQTTLPGVADLIAEIELCWTARERFLDTAFGYCLVSAADGVIGWCTTEYVSPGQCGIGIETRQPYQRRGGATITARAVADHAARLGWRVHWDSWQRNAASTRVAEKVGYEKAADYEVLFYWE